MTEEKNCLATIKSLYPSMFDSEKKISDYVLNHTERIIHLTVAELSKEVNVAESSIVRYCKKLGFDGFTQFKINLAQNSRKSEKILPENITQNDSNDLITKKVFSTSIKALEDTLHMLDKEEFNKGIHALLHAEKIEFYGVGTSASIAHDAYYRFMRIGLPAYYATDPHISRISASKLHKNCVAIGISYTGRTIDTIKSLEIAKNQGATTLCITGYMESPITKIADIKLITSTAETKVMKEAISSRIAQIAVLDSMYTCLACKRYNTYIEHTSQMEEILNNMRL